MCSCKYFIVSRILLPGVQITLLTLSLALSFPTRYTHSVITFYSIKMHTFLFKSHLACAVLWQQSSQTEKAYLHVCIPKWSFLNHPQIPSSSKHFLNMALVVPTSYTKTELDRNGSFWTYTYQPITVLPAPDWQFRQPRQRLWHPRTVLHLLLLSCSTWWHLLVPLTQNHTYTKETRASLWEWELARSSVAVRIRKSKRRAHPVCN